MRPPVPCRIICFATACAQRNVPVVLMSRMCHHWAGRYRDSVGRARNPSAADQGVDGVEGSGCGIDSSSDLKLVPHVDFKAWDSRSWKFGLQRQDFPRDRMRLMSNRARPERPYCKSALATAIAIAPWLPVMMALPDMLNRPAAVPRRLLGFGLRGLASIGQGHLRMHLLIDPVHFSLGHRWVAIFNFSGR